jgi:hypothetical protein
MIIIYFLNQINSVTFFSSEKDRSKIILREYRFKKKDYLKRSGENTYHNLHLTATTHIIRCQVFKGETADSGTPRDSTGLHGTPQDSTGG